jgi:hypothetical protein
MQVLARVETIRRVCLEMGTGELYPLLAAMLTARPWDDVVDPSLDSLVTPHSATDKLKIKVDTQHQECTHTINTAFT